MKSKSLTYADPMYTPRVSVICESGTCKLFAFSRSMVTRNCGSFAVNGVNRLTRSFRCAAPPNQPLRCCCQFIELVRSEILHDKLESAKSPSP